MKANQISDTLVQFQSDDGIVKFRVKVVGNDLLIENYQGVTQVKDHTSVFGISPRSQRFGRTVTVTSRQPVFGL